MRRRWIHALGKGKCAKYNLIFNVPTPCTPPRTPLLERSPFEVPSLDKMRWPTSEQRDAGGRLALEAATLTSSALFAGAALYISLVEQPARCALASALKTTPKSKSKTTKKSATKAALLEWNESYQRAAPLQIFHAFVAGVGGLCNTFVLGEAAAWAWGGGLMIANVPFTLLCLMPVNNELQARAELTAEMDETAAMTHRTIGKEEAVVGEGEEELEDEEKEGEPVPRRTKMCFGSWSMTGFPSTKYLLRMWGDMHMVRTWLGLSGFLVLASHLVTAAHHRRRNKGLM